MPGTTPYDDLAGAGVGIGSLEIQREEQSADDVINIQFTSGTTSSPKAACLTHRNILNNGYFIGEGLALRPADVVVCPPPLFQ
jgi:long-subunit acyl-CoA synthetase (AMP-forming)